MPQQAINHQPEFIVTGTVVRGAGRGSKLGFPTANLVLDDPLTRPSVGIYAAWTKIAPDKTSLMSAVHVGPVPTFNINKPTVEVHILDFAYQELYGQKMEVKFVKKIGEVKKFSSIEDLKQSIQDNCTQARIVLKTCIL